MLGHLIEGKIVDPDLTELGQHLEGCSDCQAKARTLFPSDTLVESLRGDATATERISASVPQQLIDALKRIPAMD